MKKEKYLKMNKMSKTEPVLNGHHGITLIALVITIIVLLILAGVTIATLTGENGILTQAETAKKATEEAEKEEQENLQKAAESIGGATQINDQTPGVLEGEGTEANPYKIQSIEDLVVFAHEVTNGRTFVKADGTKEYVELVQSLDFQSDKSYVNPEREDYGEYGYNGKLKEVLNDTGFIPIGKTIGENDEEFMAYSFKGFFDGNGYKMYNLNLQQKVKLTSEMLVAIGVFSYNCGIIQNLGIENGNVYASVESSKYSTTALLAGRNWGEIINCYTTGEVTGETTKYSSNTGGLVGGNNGRIKECYSEVNVNAKYSCRENRVGGIVGVNEQIGTIENVYNIGDIDSQVFGVQSKDYENTCLIAGVAGKNMGSIINGYSIGEISDNNNENIWRTTIDGISSNARRRKNR